MITIMAMMTVTCAGGNLLLCATVSQFAASHAPADASSPAHCQDDDGHDVDGHDDDHGDHDDDNVGKCDDHKQR